jgi:hypothetical protein
MAVYSFRTSTYARSIYLYGTDRFTARDGYTGIPEEYIPYVKQYAATNFYIDDIQNALTQNWINDQEYTDTMLLKGPNDKQYRPTTAVVAPSES